MSRRPMVVGNWKMNGSMSFARELSGAIARGAAATPQVDIAVCPSDLLLSTVAAELRSSSVALGAQSVSEFDHGAYTGETSVANLAEVGCRYVIVGHSERRHLFGESNEVAAAKAVATAAAGLIPIICVGERLADRQQGITNTLIAAQLAPFKLAGFAALNHAVIAYEPVWAIGTGETASPEQAQAVHVFIRSYLADIDVALSDATRILYGGSVKPDNATDIFHMVDVDGGLIGGASLSAQDFLHICASTPQG